MLHSDENRMFGMSFGTPPAKHPATSFAKGAAARIHNRTLQRFQSMLSSDSPSCSVIRRNRRAADPESSPT